MAKEIVILSEEPQGYSDHLCYWGGSIETGKKEGYEEEQKLVGCEKKLSAESGTDGDWIYRNRLVRYKIEIPERNENENDEIISQILKVKIAFTGKSLHSFGVDDDNLNHKEKLKNNIYCYFSQNANGYLKEERPEKEEGYIITYDNKQESENFYNVRVEDTNIKETVPLLPGTIYYLFVTADVTDQVAWCYWGGEETTATVTLTYETYTNVGAPTEIKADKKIVKPGDSLTISWTGQTDGVQNAIARYNFQYKIGKNGSYSASQDSESPSFQIVPTEGDRGKIIICRVMTIGTAAGFNSDWSAEFEVSRINQLPEPPSVVLIGRAIVPSVGGNVSFNVTAGADGDASLQSISVQYSFDNEQEKVSYTSGFPISISKTTTVKFWSWDGLETSNQAKEIKIAMNTKPKITSIAVSGTELTVGESTLAGYIISPTIKAEEISDGQLDNNTYTYYCKSGNNEYLLGSSSSSSYTVADIRKYITPGDSEKIYSLGVIRNDGIENSELKWKDGYKISKLPSIVISGFRSSPISGFEGKYDANLYVSLEPRDEGYTRVRLALANDTSRYQEININGLEVNTLTATISPRGQTNSLIASYGSLNWYHSQAEPITLYRVNQIELGTPMTNSLANNYYQVYTQPELKYTMQDPFNNNPQNYGFETAELKYFYKDQDVTASEETSNESGETSNESGIDSLTTELDCSDLSEKILLESEEKNGVSTIELEIRATNVFGTIYSKKVNLNINFNEEILISSWELQTNGAKEGTYGTFKDWDYIKEKMSLYLTASASSYNGPLTVYLEYTQNSGTTWYTLGEPLSLTSDANPSYNTPVAYSIENKEFQIGEIAQTELSRNFRVRFVNDVGSKISKTTKDNIKFRGHYPASVSMVNPSINGIILTTGYVIKGGGIGTSLTDLILRVEKEEGYEDIAYVSKKDNIYSFESENFKGVDSIRAALLATTRLEPSWKGKGELDEAVKTALTTQKTSRIIYSIVYNLVPTISLRKNHLGVNTLNPEYKDAIMVIGEVSGRQTIYFNGISGYCKFDGFIFDGGTW